MASTSAFAGAIQDGDGDLVPTQFDNCSTNANGPNQASNQVDADLDGYGNRCDTDFDQNGATTAADFGIFLQNLGCPIALCALVVDLDGNRAITAADFGVFLGKFSSPPGAPGPSGLACANPTIRTGLGDAPRTP